MVPYFKPWVGKNYENGGIFKYKILVVGDSHYCSDCESCGVLNNGNTICVDTNLNPEYKNLKYKELTHQVFYDYLNDFFPKKANPEDEGKNQNWRATWTKTTRILSSNTIIDNCDWDKIKNKVKQEVWNSVAFYDFLQTAANDNPKSKFSMKYYKASLPYFEQVVRELNPDIIIFWGGKAQCLIKKTEFGNRLENEGKMKYMKHPAARISYSEYPDFTCLKK